MDYSMSLDPKLIEAAAKFGAFLLAVLSGIVTAVWTVTKLLDDRRREREQRKYLEQDRLHQERFAEDGRRAERAAALINEFSRVTDKETRAWNALALSLYPKETLRLLVMSLGQFNDETARGVQLALIAIGPEALKEVSRLNRISQSFVQAEADQQGIQATSLYDTQRLLIRTRLVLQHILIQMDPDELSRYDLEGIDISGCNFQDASFKNLSLRKCVLKGTNFKRANLKESVLRGARLEGVVFTRASLNKADFTGAQGAIKGVKSYLEDCCFDHAQLQKSILDAASLCHSTFKNASLEWASLNGAQVRGCDFERSLLNNVAGKKMKASNARFTGTMMKRADFSQAEIAKSEFERCEMNPIGIRGGNAVGAIFRNCNLGGSNFSDSNLSDAEFRGCNVGGADFRGSNLSNCKFHKCNLASARFDEGGKHNAVFEECKGT